MLDLDVVLERSFRAVLLLALEALNEPTPYHVIAHQLLEFPPVLLLLAHLPRAPRGLLHLHHPQRLDPLLQVGHPAVELGDQLEVVHAGEVVLGELERVDLGFLH